MLLYLAMIDDEPGKALFEAIYYQYRNLMFYAARNILGNDSDAEDAVHEAFLVVIDRLDRLEDAKSSRTKAFVMTIVENKAIDLWRKRRRLGELELYETHAPTHLPEPTGLAEAMAALPIEYRSILLLRFDMGFTTREIAKMLGKKEATVTRTITRAKERLARELEAIDKEGDR